MNKQSDPLKEMGWCVAMTVRARCGPFCGQ